ncbi:MAG: hypothetical protein AAGK78_09940, partial [Planctomycetota bacterium]
MFHTSLPPPLAVHYSLLSLSKDDLRTRYDATVARAFTSIKDHSQFLLDRAESYEDAQMADATVLELGCGFGISAAAYAALGARQVTGRKPD